MHAIGLGLLLVGLVAPQDASTWETFRERAAAELGDAGASAAAFLQEHCPERDAELPVELLFENVRLAIDARSKFPWARDLTDELFWNDVLPYAVLDESRESWRPRIREITEPLVRDAKSATEAAQAINAGLFDAVNVHYDRGRKRPNASPFESIEQGRATCTGLTILFVDACRSVGIPARAAGVMSWHDDRGNHTWPEFWDGERWRFTGADEHDPAGVDRAWFVADAAKAMVGDVKHGVWASSWRHTEAHFPLAWSQDDESVPGIDVTTRYFLDSKTSIAALDELGGDDKPLSEEAADRVLRSLWKELRPELAAEFEEEAEAFEYAFGEHTLCIDERVFGDSPNSLWISLHGGGGAPPEVNDKQWRNQIRLYELENGIYVAPRAPTDTWDLWHQGHIDPLFERLIASYVARRGVDPNRVYLLGYSAGGDGVFQLAPRMADRFAAAAMMAGHTNETRPDGLRNLAFALFMGADDEAYGRNEQAKTWRDWLGRLAAQDSGGYEHFVKIYEGKAHWMDGEDKEALPWMSARTRNPWPSRVVWLQDDVVHERSYWLSVDTEQAKGRPRIEADASGAQIAISTLFEGNEAAAGVDQITLRLHDRLLDLDRPISVTWNGEKVWSGQVERRRSTIASSLRRTRDPALAATATLAVRRP